MVHFAGLDVSVKTTSVSVIDDATVPVVWTGSGEG